MYLVLRRTVKHGVKLKLRASGEPGMWLEDESLHLEEEPEKLAGLIAGKVIRC